MSAPVQSEEALIRWLHLSDLHFGCPGREAWWQAHDVFRRSIAEMSAQVGGPPHLVLLTGDLTYSGQRKEFDQLDLFCSALKSWLCRDGGAALPPLLLPVPGNHDLSRPGEESYRYSFLDLYESEHLQPLRTRLWEKRDAAPLRPLFKAYTAWMQREVLPELEARRGKTQGVVELRMSSFPGDFSMILAVGGFRLGVVGLNSAWMQYREGDYQGKLQLPAAQFLGALSQSQGSPLEFFKRCQRSLLLTHHPVSWLAPKAKAEFETEVLLPDRFDLHLHGHLHKGRVEPVQLVAGRPRYTMHGLSLFGMPSFGTNNERRSFGYSWGCIRPSGEIWVWPLHPVLRPDGVPAFERERGFAQHWTEGAVLLRPPDLVPREGPDWSNPGR